MYKQFSFCSLDRLQGVSEVWFRVHTCNSGSESNSIQAWSREPGSKGFWVKAGMFAGIMRSVEGGTETSRQGGAGCKDNREERERERQLDWSAVTCIVVVLPRGVRCYIYPVITSAGSSSGKVSARSCMHSSNDRASPSCSAKAPFCRNSQIKPLHLHTQQETYK